MKTLIETQNFKNDSVINRFKKEYPAMAIEAETVFKDLMSFFWGTQKHYIDRLSNAEDSSLDFIINLTLLQDFRKKIHFMNRI